MSLAPSAKPDQKPEDSEENLKEEEQPQELTVMVKVKADPGVKEEPIKDDIAVLPMPGKLRESQADDLTDCEKSSTELSFTHKGSNNDDSNCQDIEMLDASVL